MKKNLKALRIKIIAGFLAGICAFSVGTGSVVSVSAAEKAAISYSSSAPVNGDSKEAAVAKSMLAPLLDAIPYVGTPLKDILFSIYDAMQGDEPDQSSQEIKQALDKIQSEIDKISSTMQCSENKELSSYANSMSSFYRTATTSATDENITEICKSIISAKQEKEKVKEAYKELADLGNNPSTCQEMRELAQQIINADKTLDGCKQNLKNLLKINCDGNSFESSLNNMYTLIIGKATSTTQSDPNPFINYFNVLCKNKGFTADAKETVKEYKNSIIASYTYGVALYTEILNLLGKDEKIAELGKDFKTAIDSCAEAQKTIDNKNGYVDSNGNYTEFADIGTANIIHGKIFAVNGKAQNNLLKYIFEPDYDNADATTVFNTVNEMLTKYYTSSDKSKTMTVREFLTSKGINIPESSKYLAVGKASYDHITICNLDSVGYKAEDFCYKCETEYYKSYYDISNISYIMNKTNIDKDSAAAAVTYYNGSTEMYSSVEDAWNCASTSANSVMKLYKDWNADSHSSKYLGSGSGFTKGSITVNAYNVTLDLNGHTINRNLDKAIDNGSVITINDNFGLNVISSADKKGTITGGFTTGNGGGINAAGDCFMYTGKYLKTVRNCEITNNHANGGGGGIYISQYSNGCKIEDCTITNNSCNGDGGGVLAAVSGFYSGESSVSGKVIVTDNKANGKNENYTLDTNCFKKAIINIDGYLSSDSIIGVTTLSTQSKITITSESIYASSNIFTSDDTNHKVVEHGSDSDQYLRLEEQ